MTIAAMVMALALAQDPGKTEAQDDAKGTLKAGLEASTKAGGFTFSGRLDQDNAMGGVKIPGFGDGNLEGKFSGTVAANGTLHLKLETDKGVYELWRKGDKIVQRQTWVGKQDMVGEFPHEVTAVLSLSSLLKHVDKMKEIRAGDKKAVDGVDCTAVKAKLPTSYVPEEDDDSGMPIKMKIWELKKVESTVYVDRDGLVRRIDMVLSKGLSSMIRMAGAPGGDEEEDDGKKKEKDKDKDEDDEGGPIPGMGAMKMSATYSVTIGKYDAGAKVEVPEDVKRNLGE